MKGILAVTTNSFLGALGLTLFRLVFYPIIYVGGTILVVPWALLGAIGMNSWSPWRRAGDWVFIHSIFYVVLMLPESGEGGE